MIGEPNIACNNMVQQCSVKLVGRLCFLGLCSDCSKSHCWNNL